MGEGCSRLGEGRGLYRILVEKPEGKKPLAIPRRILEDNIKIDIQEVGVGAWTGLGWFKIEEGDGHL
jgi:hypothetical protein